MGIVRTGDCEEGFEDLTGQESVFVISRVIGHQTDDEVMGDWRHKSSKRLYHQESQ